MHHEEAARALRAASVRLDPMTTAPPLRRPALLLTLALLTSLAVTVLPPLSPSVGATTAVVPLPASELGSPAIESISAGREDILSRSASGGLTQQYLLPGGSWRRPLDRGGALASQPVTVSWGPGRLDAFARGTDNGLWHRAFADGSWSSWKSLGGRLTSAPAVASWGAGRLDVFVRGANNAMFQKSYASGSGWSGWANRGGLLTSSPAATSAAPGRIDVVVRGGSNRGYLRSFSSTAGWSSWLNLGGGMTSQPAVSAPDAGRLDVAVRGADNRMWLKRRSAAGWTGWSAIGDVTHVSGPSMNAVGDDVAIVTKRFNGFFYRSVRSSATAAWSSWQIVDQFVPFRGLATWVDRFDYAALTPATAIADMSNRGVRTLFLATARFDGPDDFLDEAKMGDWLDRAHAAGIKVVGWYVPAYGNMARDVRRTVAINDYASPTGQRFDAVGIDIERFGPSGEVNHATFNARVVPHLQQVRALTSAPIAAIVPTPFTTNAGNNWAGFPWSGIGPNSEVVVPMALWSFRAGYSAAQVRTYVRAEIDRTQALTGRRVHVEGGVSGEGATPVDTPRMAAFVQGAKDAGAIGGSNYDYLTTTEAAWWTALAGLNVP